MTKLTPSNNHVPSLSTRIRTTFIVLTTLMFVLFGGLVYFAQDRLELISLEHRLTTEAHEYMTNYRKYGFKAALPDPQELDTYWSEEERPDWLLDYNQPGFFEVQLGEEDKHFLVTKHPSGIGWLYVVYQDDADDYLDEHESQLHLTTFVVGITFLIAVIAYGLYFVRLLTAPLIKIEEKIRLMSPDEPNFTITTLYKETRSIEQTLLENKQKISAYFKREQEFSRFSSHELRTPIMVIKGSTDLLKKVPDLPNIAQKAISRIDGAGEQMQVLTEAFLLLGKEEIEEHHISHQDLSLHMNQVLVDMRDYFAKQESSYTVLEDNPGFVYAPASFVDIIMANLLKNAFSYSVDSILVELNQDTLKITNQHAGHDMRNAGYGCGLAIVSRICERMSWQFVTQQDLQNFVAVVEFGTSDT